MYNGKIYIALSTVHLELQKDFESDIVQFSTCQPRYSNWRSRFRSSSIMDTPDAHLQDWLKEPCSIGAMQQSSLAT